MLLLLPLGLRSCSEAFPALRLSLLQGFPCSVCGTTGDVLPSLKGNLGKEKPPELILLFRPGSFRALVLRCGWELIHVGLGITFL